MKTHAVVLAMIGALGLQACTSLVTTPGNSNVASVQTATVTLLTDVIVGEEIKGEASSTIILSLFTIGAPENLADPAADIQFYNIPLGTSAIETLRAGARYAALTAGKADTIVMPKYRVKTDDYFLFKKVTVAVTGYKGTYVKPVSTKR